jgi:urease accessory protein
MRIVALLLFALAAAGPALAHTSAGSGFAFFDGLKHPLLGADHLLTMVGVGLWAALAGGKARWLWPLAFVAVMAVGGAVAIAGINLPHVEPLILASVIGTGLVLAVGLRLPLAAGAAVCAAFAVAHGHAHGTELPLLASPAGYVPGFVVATSGLHALGVALGSSLLNRHSTVRITGAGIAAAGAWLAFA